MVRSNRLKQTNHKRQTKHRRQIKHGRHRQYGGVKLVLPYTDYIREFSVASNSLVIPGYHDILSMINLYYERDTLKSQLDNFIRENRETFKYYEECNISELQMQVDSNSIIVLEKKKRKFSFNASMNIKCDDNIYTTFASHNFRIFIEKILEWNPFLNYSPPKLTLESGSGAQVHAPSYNGLSIFRFHEWWNQQSWWLEYKRTLPTSLSPDVSQYAPPSPSPDASSSLPPVTITSLQEQVNGLTAEVTRLNIVNKRLQDKIMQLLIQLPE